MSISRFEQQNSIFLPEKTTYVCEVFKMCLICVDFEKEKLTLREAWANFGEMAPGMEPEHRKEVLNKLMDAAIWGDEEIDSETWHQIFQGILIL